MVRHSGRVGYLSPNAVTHPYTLRLQQTHLLPWPSEGTVRVIALGICLAGVATSRYLRACAAIPRQTPTVKGKASLSVEVHRISRNTVLTLRIRVT